MGYSAYQGSPGPKAVKRLCVCVCDSGTGLNITGEKTEVKAELRLL